MLKYCISITSVLPNQFSGMNRRLTTVQITQQQHKQQQQKVSGNQMLIHAWLVALSYWLSTTQGLDLLIQI